MAAGASASNTEYFDSAKRTDALTFDVGVAPHLRTLYNAKPPSNYNSCSAGFDSIGVTELDGFAEQGYLVVQEALAQHEVDEIVSALDEVVRDPTFRAAAAETARRQAASELNLAVGGCHPVLQYENAARHLPETQRPRLCNVRKLMGFHQHHATLRALSERPALQAAVRSALRRAGAAAEEVEELEVYQSLALLKPPGGREKPWHQDNACSLCGDSSRRLEQTQRPSTPHTLAPTLASVHPCVCVQTSTSTAPKSRRWASGSRCRR